MAAVGDGRKRKREGESDAGSASAAGAPPKKTRKNMSALSTLESKVPKGFMAGGAEIARIVAKKAKQTEKLEAKKGEAVRRGKKAQSPPRELPRAKPAPKPTVPSASSEPASAGASGLASSTATASASASATGRKRRGPKVVTKVPAPKHKPSAATPMDVSGMAAGDSMSWSAGSDDSSVCDAFAGGDEMVALDDAELKAATAAVDSVSTRRGAKPPKKIVPGVVYLGHIPYGFVEKPMRAFFSQFGDVTRLRLARNKKTGKPKHYAFVEFAEEEVAKIVAEAMHRYMLYERILVCQFVPADKVHADMFKNAERKFRRVPWRKIQRERHNCSRTPEEQAHRARQLAKSESIKNAKFAALGIDYSFDGYTQGVSAAGIAVASASASGPAPMATASKGAAKGAASKAATPKAAAPSAAVGKGAKAVEAPAASPKAAVPKAAAPKAATPKAATPKAATPKAATPKAATPKAATPKAAAPKAATPKAATPKPVSKKTSSK